MICSSPISRSKNLVYVICIFIHSCIHQFIHSDESQHIGYSNNPPKKNSGKKFIAPQYLRKKIRVPSKYVEKPNSDNAFGVFHRKKRKIFVVAQISEKKSWPPKIPEKKFATPRLPENKSSDHPPIIKNGHPLRPYDDK